MSDAESVWQMIREVDTVLAGLSLTERTREFHTQALECKRAIETWDAHPPEPARRDAMVARVTKLLADARQAAERSKGPHSQKIRIV